MTVAEKNYKIIIFTDDERKQKRVVDVSEDMFDDYFRDIDTYRRRQQRHRECVCPKSKRMMCDMDCGTCPYHRHSQVYYDSPINNDEDCETFVSDTIKSPERDFVTSLVEKDAATEILTYIETNMPELITIGKLRLQGLSDTEISKTIGIPRKAFAYRIAKIKKSINF